MTNPDHEGNEDTLLRSVRTQLNRLEIRPRQFRTPAAEQRFFAITVLWELVMELSVCRASRPNIAPKMRGILRAMHIDLLRRHKLSRRIKHPQLRDEGQSILGLRLVLPEENGLTKSEWRSTIETALKDWAEQAQEKVDTCVKAMEFMASQPSFDDLGRAMLQVLEALMVVGSLRAPKDCQMTGLDEQYNKWHYAMILQIVTAATEATFRDDSSTNPPLSHRQNELLTTQLILVRATSRSRREFRYWQIDEEIDLLTGILSREGK